MQENYFDIDIRELISSRIKKELKEKDAIIQEYKARCSKLSSENNKLKSNRELNSVYMDFLSSIRNNWNSCETKDKKVEFFINIFTTLGIEPTNPNLSFYHSFNVVTYISYVYYDHQTILKDILKLLDASFSEPKKFILLGRDYDKKMIKDILESPIYLTNGEMFGMCLYTFPLQMPYDEIFLNKCILDEDVVSVIFETIHQQRGAWDVLLEIDKYVDISDEMINELFHNLKLNNTNRSIDKLPKSVINFLKRNVSKLSLENQRTLVYLNGVITNSCYSVMAIRNFNKEIITEYLNNLEINEALDILYNSKFSPQDICKYITTHRSEEFNNINTVIF